MKDSEWNDGYYAEAMDRCHVILTMIDEILTEHPAIDKLDLQWNIDHAVQEIFICYQILGDQDKTWED